MSVFESDLWTKWFEGDFIFRDCVVHHNNLWFLAAMTYLISNSLAFSVCFLIIGFILNEIVFLLITISSLLMYWVLYVPIAYMVNSDAPNVLCGGYFAFPAWSVQQLVLLGTWMTGLRYMYPRARSITIFNLCVVWVILILTVVARYIMEMNSLTQIVGGASLGVFWGFVSITFCWHKPKAIEWIANWRWLGRPLGMMDRSPM